MSDAPRIVFLDSTAPKPYDAETLVSEPQGGTESTVTRVAEGLAARGYEVIVFQRVRKEPGKGRAIYLSFDQIDHVHRQPHAAISLRSPQLIPFSSEQFPNARRFLWLHDFNQQEVVRQYDSLKGSGTKIICVSRMHKTTVADALISQIGVVEGLTVDFIYNPIADELQPDSTEVDSKKLIFFSSPHKGLDHALYLFERLKSVDPSFRLHISNPGYLPSRGAEASGVHNHDVLNHPAVIREVRSALAVFHPNLVFPETFGLVHAEANAVGTPVITSALGANREVVGDPRQLLNVRDEKLVIDTILRWSNERPVVKGKDEFRLSNIINQWEIKLGLK